MHDEGCGESNIIHIVNSVNITNEVVIITNAYDESSCDENDSFLNFDMNEVEIC